MDKVHLVDKIDRNNVLYLSQIAKPRFMKNVQQFYREKDMQDGARDVIIGGGILQCQN